MFSKVSFLQRNEQFPYVSWCISKFSQLPLVARCRISYQFILSFPTLPVPIYSQINTSVSASKIENLTLVLSKHICLSEILLSCPMHQCFNFCIKNCVTKISSRLAPRFTVKNKCNSWSIQWLVWCLFVTNPDKYVLYLEDGRTTKWRL